MKVNIKPEGVYQGEGQVFLVKSESNPMGWHMVAIIGVPCCDDPLCKGMMDSAVCSCTGFQVHHHCWHVTEGEGVWEWADSASITTQRESDPSTPSADANQQVLTLDMNSETSTKEPSQDERLKKAVTLVLPVKPVKAE